MSETKTQVSGGVGFFGLLALLFIGLKLTGYISWPWLWVLSPIWLPLVVSLVAVGIIFLLVGLFVAVTLLLMSIK